ncbi:MAG: DcaP family trimeric outer membrane transporter [Rickettsiales bacterium]
MKTSHRVAYAFFALAWSGAALFVARPALALTRAEELKELRLQVKMLTKRVEEMEAQEKEETQKNAAVPVAAAKPPEDAAPMPPADKIVTAGAEKNSWKIPGTDMSLKIGGFAKLDAIADVGTAYGAPYASFGAIPLDGSTQDKQSEEFNMHARSSRFSLTGTSPTPQGDAKLYVEADFLGAAGNEKTSNGHGLQLRHFYGEWAGLLAGQTWTTFFDSATYPETLDANGPVGMTISRQPQLRYTKKIGKGAYSIALENPYSDFSDPSSPSVGSALEKTPDLVGMGKWDVPFGTISVAGLARDLHVENATTGTNDSEFGWGLAVASVIKTGLGADGKDDIRLRVAGGDGIGRYMYEDASGGSSGAAGNSGGANAAAYNGSVLDAQPTWGGYASYHHFWTKEIRSNVMGGYVRTDNNVDMLPSLAGANATVWSGHVNTYWQPIDRFAVGAEYMHGERELENGLKGDLDRIMASVMYYL